MTYCKIKILMALLHACYIMPLFNTDINMFIENEALREHLQQSLPSVEQTYMKISALNLNKPNNNQKINIQQEESVQQVDNGAIYNEIISDDGISDNDWGDDSGSDSDAMNVEILPPTSRAPLEMMLSVSVFIG